jgi:hypothetical protein
MSTFIWFLAINYGRLVAITPDEPDAQSDLADIRIIRL